LIKELTTYINTNTTLVLGTTLFAGEIPVKTDGLCVLIQETPGGDRNTNPYSKDVGTTLFHIITRGNAGAGYFTNRDLAYEVFDLLNAKTQVTLPVVDSTTYVVNIYCTPPGYAGRDERHRATHVSYISIIQQEV